MERPVLGNTGPWVPAVMGKGQKQGLAQPGNLGFLEEVAAEWSLAG